MEQLALPLPKAREPIASDVVRSLRARGGTWAAYRNVVLDSATCGDTQFLRYGPGCTHETLPPHLHDGPHGAGWKYRCVGLVDIEAGEIVQW